MKSCFFIGHREADERLLPALKKAIEQLIAEDFCLSMWVAMEALTGSLVLR